MTAEIAVMNKDAIALAADSAVTIGRNEKIYNTVNKLFTLSKYYPVGVMIYGSAELMQISWETIIKIFRKQFGKKKFDTLSQYADEFIKFLNSANPLFPEAQQERHFRGEVYFHYKGIQKDIDKRVAEEIRKKNEINNDEISAIVLDEINKFADSLKKYKALTSITQDDVSQVLEKYKKAIEDIKNEVFQQLPVSDEAGKILIEIAGLSISREWFQGSSGIVIAGFGEKETFPSLQAFSIEGVINSKLIYRKDNDAKVGYDNAATIIPFAQREMVDTFVRGINPEYVDWFQGYLSELFKKLPDEVANSISLEDAVKKP